MFKRSVLALVVFVALAIPVVSAASASAEALQPWFHLDSVARPGNLPPEGKGEIVVTAINVGDAGANGEAAPIKLTDRLPRGLKALLVEGNTKYSGGDSHGPVKCELKTLTCVYEDGCRPAVCRLPCRRRHHRALRCDRNGHRGQGGRRRRLGGAE